MGLRTLYREGQDSIKGFPALAGQAKKMSVNKIPPHWGGGWMPLLEARPLLGYMGPAQRR